MKLSAPGPLPAREHEDFINEVHMKACMNSAARAPHTVNPSNLPAGHFLLMIDAYDEATDSFRIELHDASPSAGLVDHQLPAVMVPFLVGECGEPGEFEDTRWIVAHPGF